VASTSSLGVAPWSFVSTYELASTPIDPTDVAGKRIVAAIIDVGLGWVLYMLSMYVAFSLYSEPNAPLMSALTVNNACGGAAMCSTFNDRHVAGLPSALPMVVFVTYLVGVFLVQRGITARTLGTAAMGLATVNEQGEPIGIGIAVVRSVIGVVDYLPCCLPVVGLVTMITTTGHRRVGDMAAKTYMIDSAYIGVPVQLKTETNPSPPDAQAMPSTMRIAAPPATPAPPATTTPPATPAPGTDPTTPQWDPARNAYIQWDATGQRWLQFNDKTQQWTAIS